MSRVRTALSTFLAATLLVGSAVAPAAACTRAVFIGSDGVVITGRSMDWAEDMSTNLWAFPRGMTRDGAAGPNSPRWTSKYGSVVASGYDIGTTDGLNEAGLVANLLYLAESDYGGTGGKPPLAISLWAQYVLDNFATTAEAVAALEAEPFRVVTADLPNGRRAQLHLSISDASGDSAIFEYIDGRLVVHHGRQYTVMTNSPSFDQQLALDSYWQAIGGLTFLPGTNTFWVPLADLNLSEGAPVRKLAVAGGVIYSGNAAGHFVPSPPFTFMPITAP